jgi:dTDP-4-dehydrorhamnose 3,5-epimerase
VRRSSLRFVPTSIPGLVIVEPDVFRDARGFFVETFHEQKYGDAGIEGRFVQDNHSRSARGTLRGLHAQLRRPQGKLVRAVRGEVFDVAVDIRPRSPTFGKWVSTVLSGENFRQVFVPPGLAHGFCVLSEEADIEYKCTDFYVRDDEIGIRWDDPSLAIPWPIREPLLSAKDASLPLLEELKKKLA